MKKAGKVIMKELLILSAEQKITFQNVQTMFLLERMVARLTGKKELFNSIVFKGGYVALRVFQSPRFTIDLDALINCAEIKKTETMAIEAIEQDIQDGTWFKYEKRSDLTTLGEYGGTRLWFRCGIGDVPEKFIKAQSIHLDLGVGDAVFPAPQINLMNELLTKNTVLWKVYPIESAVAEKLHTLIIRNSDNSRSKDVFDLYFLLPKCSIQILKEALSATFSSRRDLLPEKILPAVVNIDMFLLEKGWKSATAGLSETVPIEKAFETIIEYCKKIDG